MHTDAKRCGCTLSHDVASWARLPLVGVMRDEVEAIELRNCPCGSTLAVSICIVGGCNERATWAADDLRDYCNDHANEWLLSETRQAAIWSKVDKNGPPPAADPSLGPCWIWTAHRSTRGYGRVWKGGKCRQAHRVVYGVEVGPVAIGMELDHLCRVRACVNPAHLEPVTHAENVRRGLAKKTHADRGVIATHCRNGHPFAGGNLVLAAKTGERRCRACRNAGHNQRAALRREEAA